MLTLTMSLLTLFYYYIVQYEHTFSEIWFLHSGWSDTETTAKSLRTLHRHPSTESLLGYIEQLRVDSAEQKGWYKSISNAFSALY